jgi:hypothetical protein
MLKGEEAPVRSCASPLALGSDRVTRVGMALRAEALCSASMRGSSAIGNITLGGTGKTPAVIARAEQEIAQGAKWR